MFDFLTVKIKLIIAAVSTVLIFSLLGYAYYNIFVVPRNEIKKLKATVVEAKELPRKIVSRINTSDANRTQEEINNVKTEDTIVHDSGILIF